eukprot:83412-Hanusia_phi.AAC.1
MASSDLKGRGEGGGVARWRGGQRRGGKRSWLSKRPGGIGSRRLVRKRSWLRCCIDESFSA